MVNFNPRTRTGCDAFSRMNAFSCSEFQSTHPHGVRRHTFALSMLIVDFNPRTRTGCDFRLRLDGISNLNFNPRTRTGCDPTDRGFYLVQC